MNLSSLLIFSTVEFNHELRGLPKVEEGEYKATHEGNEDGEDKVYFPIFEEKEHRNHNSWSDTEEWLNQNLHFLSSWIL